ncbi:MAG: magnesium transporter CorA family protein [Thaumarchaeota archaeon]|nr:magnesium transporter CorA family protein [Nitrososphaerota archaeon]MDE1841412.1 magnesium transporter CorA family protein [Nitrososphaerota archaeon]
MMKTIDNGRVTWIDIEQPTKEELDNLALKYPSFHQLNLDDCLSKIQLSKIDKYEDHSFIILRIQSIVAASHDEGISNKNNIGILSSSITVNHLSIFVGPDYVVSVHQHPFKSLSELFQSYDSNSGIKKPAQNAPAQSSPAFLVYRIIDGLVDELLNILSYVESDLDNIEDTIFGGVGGNKLLHSTSKQISALRREINTLRRTIIPLKRVTLDTSEDMKRFSNGEKLAPYYSDIKDHIEKVLDELDASKETIEVYNDTDFKSGTEKSNKILGILTILFTLTIPVTVISSFYGMNIEIPGTVQSGPWTFLGYYTTMILVVIVSIIPALVMFLYFYRKKWMDF